MNSFEFRKEKQRLNGITQFPVSSIIKRDLKFQICLVLLLMSGKEIWIKNKLIEIGRKENREKARYSNRKRNGMGE